MFLQRDLGADDWLRNQLFEYWDSIGIDHDILSSADFVENESILKISLVMR